MSFIATDWSIALNWDIRYIGNAHGWVAPSYSSVLEFHRALQNLADDASYSGDDRLDITMLNPSDKSTDNIVTLLNGYNIDDTSAEHLYDGSIIQSSGAVIYDGIKVFAPSGTNIQIIQNGAVIATDWWNTGVWLNADPANGVSHNFMLKVRTGWVDIDGRRFIAIAREWGSTYDEFKVNGTTRGLNVVALKPTTDLNNTTAVGTVAWWTGITNLTEGYSPIDVTWDGTNEYYYSKWDRSTYSINQFYERMKWLTRDGTSSTLYGLSGKIFRGITHEITIDTPTGTFASYEPVSWTGWTGQMLAINSPTAGTKMWIQLLTGVVPLDNQVITGGTSWATCMVNVSVIERSVSSPFVGVSTGSALIGAFGFGVEATDLGANDKVLDLTDTQRVAPNNVTFSVLWLASGDRVIVTADSSGIQKNQLSLSGTLTGASVTSLTVASAIPADTPSSGTIRVQRNSGVYTLVNYSSWTGSTFTIASTNFSADNATSGNNVFISYIDAVASWPSLTFTSVYASDRTLFIRVKNGSGSPIKTFETTWVLGSSGGSSTAVRTSDL